MKNGNLKSRMKKITIIEWIVSAAGTFFFLFTLLFVLYNAIFTNGSPPDINMKIISIEQTGGDYLVIIEAMNNGDESVEGLEVEAVLGLENMEIEKGSTTFDYVPAHSKRKGGIFFKKNPNDYKIAIRPLGYEEP